LRDGIDGFHAAYADGRLVTPPDMYLELIVIPAVLHTPWTLFREYPPALQEMTKSLVMSWLAGGQGLNLDVIRAQD
jgi:hypothetical protein